MYKLLLADDEAAAMFKHAGHGLVVVQLACILACLVVAQESADEHAVQSMLVLVNDNVEVTHQIVGEIIFGHLVEQLVLVDRVGLVGQQEYITGVALEGQRVHLGGVAALYFDGAT